ncbi:hypothetical protein DFH27DRAFT_545045 [Peziza echinospora]|nr:hypothetical protein DFH27DRAFT_545045 [Peziza echinospora]
MSRTAGEERDGATWLSSFFFLFMRQYCVEMFLVYFNCRYPLGHMHGASHNHYRVAPKSWNGWEFASLQICFSDQDAYSGYLISLHSSFVVVSFFWPLSGSYTSSTFFICFSHFFFELAQIILAIALSRIDYGYRLFHGGGGD